MDDQLDPLVAKHLDELLAQFPPAGTEPTAFWAARFDAGLAWVHDPDGCGGLAADPEQHALVSERLVAAGVPSNFPVNPIGLGMVGPTIVHHGTPEQRQRYLRRLYACEDIWCQMFSEPGAGSDLASLATRAERDGDQWVINGQKVWTSLGHKAEHGLLLARTDIDAPKNRGITAFLVDMTLPSVDVRPLRQMTGDAEFNEVYLTDVRLPAKTQLGPEGKGWQVATTTLMNERVSNGSSLASSGPMDRAVDLFRNSDRRNDAVVRDRVARLWIESEVGRMVTLRAAQLGQTGDPGPVGSIGKLFTAEHALRAHDLTVDLLGAAAMLYDDGPSPQRSFLRSRANTIEGGTSEVMRNILGERVLGLARDDHGPKDRPWREIPRS